MKTPARKLIVRREAIRALNNESLTRAVGGDSGAVCTGVIAAAAIGDSGAVCTKPYG
jgi:hypothetical protein